MTQRSSSPPAWLRSWPRWAGPCPPGHTRPGKTIQTTRPAPAAGLRSNPPGALIQVLLVLLDARPPAFFRAFVRKFDTRVPGFQKRAREAAELRQLPVLSQVDLHDRPQPGRFRQRGGRLQRPGHGTAVKG